MKALNLFTISRVNGIDNFSRLERQLSQRESILDVKQHEFDCVINLINLLTKFNVDFDDFDGFHYSYKIPQISKEFDLLKVCREQILNIELKSEDVGIERIRNQLLRNRYYLSHLDKEISLYTLVKSNGKVYKLDCNNVIEVKIENLADKLKELDKYYVNDLNAIFNVSDFLVSPLNTPDKFLEGNYFLTPHQEDIKKDYLDKIRGINECKFFGVTGSPGTGKTLLLYDLALESSKINNVCIIHCGILSEGHMYLNDKLDNVEIIDAKQINSGLNFSNYRFIFIDECHRIFEHQYRILIEAAKQNNLITTFSYDSQQILSRREERSDIATEIEKLENYKLYGLTNRIRTNKELGSFIRRLRYLNHTDTMDRYPSVLLFFAKNKAEAEMFLNDLIKKGYTFINYTPSNYKGAHFDNYSYLAESNTHRVIGQEFGKVVMIMDNNFFYNEDGLLQGKIHPNPDYLYVQLLYQGLTRVREKLALIIVGDENLLSKILSILD